MTATVKNTKGYCDIFPRVWGISAQDFLERILWVGRFGAPLEFGYYWEGHFSLRLEIQQQQQLHDYREGKKRQKKLLETLSYELRKRPVSFWNRERGSTTGKVLSELKVKNFKMFMLEKELIVRVPGEFMKVLASSTIGENAGSIIYGLGLKMMNIIFVQASN